MQVVLWLVSWCKIRVPCRKADCVQCCSQILLSIAGSQSKQCQPQSFSAASGGDAACLYPAGGKSARPVPPNLSQAMQQQQSLRSMDIEAQYNPDGTLKKPPELLSQLALKRGVPFRGGSGGVDTMSPEVMAALVAGKPAQRYLHKNDAALVNARLHWYDELQG